jgi:tetratricopeptide (TPR) repeat protein
LGNETKAIEYYNRALTIDPNFIEATIFIGDTYADLGNYTQAINYYDKALTGLNGVLQLIQKSYRVSQSKDY